jgi:hypothetical protein
MLAFGPETRPDPSEPQHEISPLLRTAQVSQRLAAIEAGDTAVVQTPSAHRSAAVHALPSSQGAALFVWTQPVDGSQASSVQGLPSSQATPGAGVCRHPDAGAQESDVQTLPSSQLGVPAPGRHAPPVHESPDVHALPSSHEAPSGVGIGGEQSPVAWSHVDDTWQLPGDPQATPTQ